MKTANPPRQHHSIATILAAAELTSERDSAITSEWRVAWTIHECARDVFQNFRDANEHFEHIRIETCGTRTTISAPVAMDLALSFFLGSTKSKDTERGNVGQFGEGLKVAALCMIRD
jgi:hypothetical protein